MKDNKALTIKEKINCINATKDFKSIELGWFPPCTADEYYFVSYCHKDYKKVFKNLLELEDIPVWYDRDLPVGTNWKIEAKNHIFDFNCKGIIFYISENFIHSDAIFKEIEFVRESGKQYVPIYLTANEEYAIELIKSYNGDKEKKQILQKMFNGDITYLHVSDSIDKITDKIKSIKKLSLFDHTIDSDYFNRNQNSLTKIQKEGPHNIIVQERGQIHSIRNINICSLKESDFPKYTLSLGTCCMANCRSLEEVILPDTLMMICSFSFFGCIKLRNITLTSSIKEIENEAFTGCSNLRNVYYTGSLEDWSTILFGNYTSNPMYNASQFYTKNNDNEWEEVTSVQIPNTIKTIGNYQFYGFSNVLSVTISNGVRSIGDYAFSKCSSLITLILPNSLISIGDWAFYLCSSLEIVTIPNSVTSIGDKTFYYCSSLMYITIPSSCIKIGEWAFRGCRHLKNIYYGGSIEDWCKITFTDLASNPMSYASHFYLRNSNNEWEEVTSIEVPNTILNIENNQFYGFKNVNTIVIPNSVISIGKSAFACCQSLTSIEIPNSVTKIGEEAFYCSSLSDIYYTGTKKEWNKVSIGREALTNPCKIHCLDGIIDYKK